MREGREFFFDEANDGMRSGGRSFDNYDGGYCQDTFGYADYDNGFEESFDSNQNYNVRQQPLYREVRREQEEFGNKQFQPIGNYGYQGMSKNFCYDDRWLYDPIYPKDYNCGCNYGCGFGNDNIWWIIIIAIFFFGCWGFCFF